MKIKAGLSTATLALCMAPAAFAAEEAAFSNTLTGDWGGTRTKLADAGVDMEIVYTADVMSNMSGGIDEGTRGLDNLDLIATFDGEKLLGWKGGSALLHVLNNNGGRPDADLVGSAQGIDNIEVPRSGGRLFEAWLQQNLFDDKLSILAGLYAVDSEFYVTDSSGLFIHSTFGIGTDIAQGGQNGPSIFPFTSAGVRVKVAPCKETYVMAALLDGVPGDPNHIEGTHIDLNSNDGGLVVAEAGYTPEGAKIAIGGWYYTEKTPELIAPVSSTNEGAYIIGEKLLYTESEGQGLTAFARIGTADSDINQFNYAWSTGVVYTGLIPGRDEGQLGFGLTGAHNSGTFRQAAVIAGTPMDTAETTAELTYSDNITPWLSVQPDLQYVVNPGTDPAIDNAWVIGARFTVTF